MSATLYTLYTNEVLELQKLLNTKIFNKITKSQLQQNYTNINHIIIDYIDDLTNIISTKDHDTIKAYLEDYYELLHNYYNLRNLT